MNNILFLEWLQFYIDSIPPECLIIIFVDSHASQEVNISMLKNDQPTTPKNISDIILVLFNTPKVSKQNKRDVGAKCLTPPYEHLSSS